MKSGVGTLALTAPIATPAAPICGAARSSQAAISALGSGALTIGAARLTIDKNLSLANAVILANSGSAIDTAGFDLFLAGNLSGPGTLTKAGAGMLTLSGTNSQNGIIVAGGILAFGSDAALGRAAAS